MEKIIEKIERQKQKHITLLNVVKIIDYIISKVNIQNEKKVHLKNQDAGVEFTIDVEKYKQIVKDFRQKLSEYEDNIIYHTFGVNNVSDDLSINSNFDVDLRNFILNFSKHNIPLKADISKLMEQYQYYNNTNNVKKINFDICCDLKMTPHNNNSEMLCLVCNKILKMNGSYYEDPFYDKHKAKYESIRHCKEWLCQIQAKELISKKTLDADIVIIEEKLKKIYGNNIYYHPSKNNKIPCYRIREVLKDKSVNLTWYNNHIPYIRKLITGYIPTQLTCKEEQQILNYFVICENTFDTITEEEKDKTNLPEFYIIDAEGNKQVILFENKNKVIKKPKKKKLRTVEEESDGTDEDSGDDSHNKNSKVKDKKPNMRYYPYFIYKILEIVILDKNKLNSLLECIHIQSDDTLNNHDDVWFKICESAPQLRGKYLPTDKYKIF